MTTALLILLLSQVNTSSFPYSKGVAVQGIAADGGNVQAYGIICGSNMSCSGSQFGWVTLSSTGDGGGGSGGAPTNASYITEVAESGLSNEFAMASLGTGLVKNTTTTGVPSIYGGTSCTNQFPRSLNASGAATCASVSLTADVTGTLPQGNGGTGATALTCTSGQCLTSNGSAYSCTSSITANDVSCSGCVSLTAEVSGTTPVGNGGTNLTSATDDDVMVGNGTTWQSKSVPDCDDSSGNHLNYDTGANAFSCGTSQLHDVGGSSPQVQYNNSGAFGGIADVTSDGTHQILTPVNVVPSAPSSGALHFDFFVDAGFLPVPMIIDSFSGLASPIGMLSEMFTPVKDWDVQCESTQGWSNNTLIHYRTNGTVSTLGSVNSDAWATTSLLTRSKMNSYTTLSSANLQAGIKNSGVQSFWRGNAGGAGGFLLWQRASMKTTVLHSRWAFGAFAATSAIGATAEPSASADSVYFGCDNGDTNLSICSNDNSGSATCNTLGSSYPCTTNGAWYDFFIWAAPGASTIQWAIQRLDSAASNYGVISSDLPRNTVQLNWQQYGSNADAGASIALGFFGMCFAAHM